MVESLEYDLNEKFLMIVPYKIRVGLLTDLPRDFLKKLVAMPKSFWIGT